MFNVIYFFFFKTHYCAIFIAKFKQTIQPLTNQAKLLYSPQKTVASQQVYFITTEKK